MSLSSRGNLIFFGKTIWSQELWYEPNSLTEDSAPELWTWEHNQTLLSDRVTNQARNDANVIEFQSNKKC
jgi:hypothetical protein